jgi:hypothetical protein
MGQRRNQRKVTRWTTTAFDGSTDAEGGVNPIFVGGMTLEEYLRGDTVYDDVPSFISPGYLRDLDRRGLLIRKRQKGKESTWMAAAPAPWPGT